MVIENKKDNFFISSIISLIIIFLSLIPFFTHYKSNDNHLNWLNHDYAKNLLMCTEMNSIFMTEGGDNQVFGSLYLTYAEKLRPDISPYDQKGNIFKRIYGDMRYIDPNTLARRMDLVDKHLFSGQEPFYIRIRDIADPYFIPYIQGLRPVYLTWQRPEPWKLGDYYYKRYGIMYKVQPAELALVDYLELKKELTFDEAIAYFSNLLKRNIDFNWFTEKINILKASNYIEVNNNKIIYKKSYPLPHNLTDEELLNKLLIRWHNIPNAKYWDHLSKEIIISYDYQMGDIYRDKISELKQIRANEKRPEIISNIDRMIKENWEKAKAHYFDAIKYGQESISVLHNVPVVFMQNDMEDLSNEIRTLLRRALQLYESSWGTYSLYFSFLMIDSLKNINNEEENLKDFEKYMNQLKKVLPRYKSSKGRYDQHPVWKNFVGIENYYNMCKELPLKNIYNNINILKNQITEKKVDGGLAQQTITMMYNRAVPVGYTPMIQEADQLLNSCASILENDTMFQMWLFNFAPQLQKFNLAFNAGKRLEKLAPDTINYSFDYSMGQISYILGNLKESKFYMSRFLKAVEKDRKLQINLRDYIIKAQEIVEK